MTLSTPLNNERGVTLLVVLVMLVVLGLSAGIAGSTWSSVMHREREEQLLWVGDQYRKAIESYVTFNPREPGGTGAIRAVPTGIPLYPNRLEDLLRDQRASQVVRHIRKLYKDPFTGEDFELVKDQGGRIKGVRSASKLEPFKTDGFDKVYEDFRDAESYQKWEFIYDQTKSSASRSNTGTGSSTPTLPSLPGIINSPTGSNP
ncbi:type II secretion system pseudopilin TklG [Desulfuromonas versatilis]|uniref:Type II secretion system pseudopilin TklG n=1 Tax=Desulfuromonas versatilis TaxID=2802975 RepID=A0ABN6E0W3_9BACT|nr:hypothetical protein [Desulfuromonas versatilis]BCR05973.1 type II secretion system pseudopilin TklG [Desulfuromonas versatilis]